MNDHLPSHRRYFSQSKPLALELGENFMSRSMVTLTKGVSITRPAALLIFDPKYRGSPWLRLCMKVARHLYLLKIQDLRSTPSEANFDPADLATTVSVGPALFTRGREDSGDT